MLTLKGQRLWWLSIGAASLLVGLLCVRAGLVPWPPQSSTLVKALRRESVKQDLIALNDLARMGLLSEGELAWDDIDESVGDTNGALVLGWASRRKLQRHEAGEGNVAE